MLLQHPKNSMHKFRSCKYSFWFWPTLWHVMNTVPIETFCSQICQLCIIFMFCIFYIFIVFILLCALWCDLLLDPQRRGCLRTGRMFGVMWPVCTCLSMFEFVWACLVCCMYLCVLYVYLLMNRVHVWKKFMVYLWDIIIENK